MEKKKKNKPKPEIEFYSYSQFNTYRRCPRRYYYRYIRRMEAPNMPYFAFGISSHRALEYNYKQKETSYIDVPRKVMGEVFVAAMEEQKDKVDWKAAEVKYIDERDKGVDMIEQYRDEVAPKIQPLKTEVGETVKIAELSKPFLFRIDLIDKNYLIIDTKFVKRSPPEADIILDLQLSSYVYCLLKLPKKQKIFTEEQYKIFKSKKSIPICLDIVNKNKFSYKRLKTYRDKQALQWFAFQIREMDKAIQKKIFFPIPVSWVCKGCGYYDVCRKEK